MRLSAAASTMPSAGQHTPSSPLKERIMKTPRKRKSRIFAGPRRWAVSGVLVAGLSFAPPSLAAASHGGCGDGANAFTVPLAQAGQLDDIVVPLATTGQAHATVAGLHATYCDPRP
jgi:hypothetical protein